MVYWTSSQREGGHPAVIAFGEDGVVTWGGEALAEKALSLARGLRVHGIDNGNAVALWAPNSPVWIAAALGVVAAGGMLVPIDDLADAEQLEAALKSSGARLILTTARHLDASGAILRAHRCHCDSYRQGGRSDPAQRPGRLRRISEPKTSQYRLTTNRPCCPGLPARPARPRHSC